jgi:hypothetical protein
VIQRRPLHILSDYFPILLDCGVTNRGGGYFMFENVWLKYEGFVHQVKLWWQSYHFHGSPSHVLACKLKSLKGDLRRWNDEIFGHVGKRKKVLLDGIWELDGIGEGRGLNEEEGRRKDKFSMDLERLLLCEEISWC